MPLYKPSVPQRFPAKGDYFDKIIQYFKVRWNVRIAPRS